jgi:hypothetical protein
MIRRALVWLITAPLRGKRTPEQIDWDKRLADDVAVRKALVGKPFAKRRAAALKGLRG